LSWKQDATPQDGDAQAPSWAQGLGFIIPDDADRHVFFHSWLTLLKIAKTATLVIEPSVAKLLGLHESLTTGTLHVGARPKTVSMMANDTSSFSRSGTPMPKPKFIGDRWMETPPKRRSYRGKASRPRPESSGLRLSANQIGKSNTDTFCLG
jgi:hypothetical protein